MAWARTDAVPFTLFDAPASSETRPSGITDAGQIVGESCVGSGQCVGLVLDSYGFLYDQGVFTVIDGPETELGEATSPSGLNNNGQIGGTFDKYSLLPGNKGVAFIPYGFLRGGTHFTLFQFPTAGSTFPSGITDAGQIVGEYDFWDPPHPPEDILTFVFLKDGTNSTTLNLRVPGDSTLYVGGLKNKGQIVGTLENSRRGFLIDGANFTSLNVPGFGYESDLDGINDTGQIIGFRDGSIYGDLLKDGEDFSPVNVPGATAAYPTTINHKGQIVGYFATSADLGRWAAVCRRDVIRHSKYFNNLVEQDQRVVKRVTPPMLGFNSFWAAWWTIAGIEVMHAIHKGQLGTTGTASHTPVEQFYDLAAHIIKSDKFARLQLKIATEPTKIPLEIIPHHKAIS